MTYYEVRDKDICHNIEVIRERANVPIWGVLKYDGYGMGLIHMAEVLIQCGVSRFAVTDAEEAHKLRMAGFVSEDILLLSPQSRKEEIHSGLNDRVIFSVGSLEYAQKLLDFAYFEDFPIRIHISVDTGMGRFGFLPSQYQEIRLLYQKEKFRVEGIYSHFSNSYSDNRKTLSQYHRFLQILHQLEADHIDRGMAHIANSPALFRDIKSTCSLSIDEAVINPQSFEESKTLDSFSYEYNTQENIAFSDNEVINRSNTFPTLDAVRIGSAIVGRVAGTMLRETGLRQVGTLISTVCDVRSLPKGSTIGYGSEWKLKKDSQIAILSAGGRAGIPSISRKDKLLRRYPIIRINGSNVPLAATHSNGHSFADVTNLSVQPGDKALIDVNPLRIDSSIERVYIP